MYKRQSLHVSENKHVTLNQGLVRLEDGEGFAMNYIPSRIDRDSLFALNKVFSREKIAQVRTKYHRSRLEYDYLRDDLLEYKRIHAPRTKDPVYKWVLESIIHDLSPSTLIIPLTTGAVAKHPDLPRSKSAGLSAKKFGHTSKGQAVDDPEYMHFVRKTWHELTFTRSVVLPDAAAFARAQITSRDKNKIRATWGYDALVYLEEGRWFYPLLQHFKTTVKPFIAYGLEMANGGMEYLHSMATSHPGSRFVMADWKKFDKTIPAWLLRDVFEIIGRWFDMSKVLDSEGKIWNVRSNRSQRRWDAIVDYFINTPIQLSSGERYLKQGGVPSGSCFTNIIDSIVGMIVMRYCTYHATGTFPQDEVYLGDDSFIVINVDISLESVKEKAFKTFGMVLNTDKSYVTTSYQNIYFLGYFNDFGTPLKPIDTIIASTIYPERPVRTKMDSISRMIGQAYSCFDPELAGNFFRAAKILQEESDHSMDEVIEYVRTHPWQFKYLQTIGVDVTKASFPLLNYDHFTMRTISKTPRRRYTPRFIDWNYLYQLALSRDEAKRNSTSDYGSDDSDIEEEFPE